MNYDYIGNGVCKIPLAFGNGQGETLTVEPSHFDESELKITCGPRAAKIGFFYLDIETLKEIIAAHEEQHSPDDPAFRRGA